MLMRQITRNHDSEPLPSSVCDQTYAVKVFTCDSSKTSEHCFGQNVQNDCDIRMNERNKANNVKDTVLIVY